MRINRIITPALLKEAGSWVLPLGIAVSFVAAAFGPAFYQGYKENKQQDADKVVIRQKANQEQMKNLQKDIDFLETNIKADRVKCYDDAALAIKSGKSYKEAMDIMIKKALKATFKSAPGEIKNSFLKGIIK